MITEEFFREYLDEHPDAAIPVKDVVPFPRSSSK
jgi:hypothetical protein